MRVVVPLTPSALLRSGTGRESFIVRRTTLPARSQLVTVRLYEEPRDRAANYVDVRMDERTAQALASALRGE